MTEKQIQRKWVNVLDSKEIDTTEFEIAMFNCV